MKDALDAGLVNPSSTEYFEEDVRKVFSAGEAAFALNWAYMFNLANNEGPETKIAGQVGIAPAPGAEGGAANAAINGSMGLGIPSNAAHPDEAWKLITFMTSQPVQNQYAQARACRSGSRPMTIRPYRKASPISSRPQRPRSPSSRTGR